MTQLFFVTDEAGGALDARFAIDGRDILFQSRGGAKGNGVVNADYTRGLLLLVKRLSAAAVPINAAWVDSATVQNMTIEDRTILNAAEGRESPERICTLMASRMKTVRNRSEAGTKGGNSTKKIRISTGFNGESNALMEVLLGIPVEGDVRSRERLPAEVLNKATPDYVFEAIQLIQAGEVEHSFGPSTDFDLIADDGSRLPPKAVFGVALSLALGGTDVGPRHFTAGETSPCFRLLRDAGYLVVPKSTIGEAVKQPKERWDEVRQWDEGTPELRSHMARERGRGLASAKKAEFRRLHGVLKCERCNVDPVAHYQTPHAEACIEVHHASVHVQDMGEAHRTKLSDLQCLCANCHRIVHREDRLLRGLARS